MITLFNVEAADGRQTDHDADPRTSFREVQPQDAVIWIKSIYDTYLARLTEDINDHEAVEWFLSEDKSQFTFLSFCSIFGIDADAIREAIHKQTPKGKKHA